MSGPGAGPAGNLRALAASAWAFRWKVEREAEVRFEALAARLAALDGPAQLVGYVQPKPGARTGAGELREVEDEQHAPSSGLTPVGK